MRSQLLLALACLALFANNGSAAIIGTNPPAQPVTVERVAALPKAQQPTWGAYLKNSERQGETDRTFFKREMQRNHVMTPVAPPETRGVKGIPLDKPASWYGEAEALRIADIVISFQTPAGGWSKNIDMTKDVRAPGERFSADNTSRYPTTLDNDAPHDRDWNYVGTFDNDATVTQLRFLAKVVWALELKQTAENDAVRTPRPTGSDKRYRAAVMRGLDYIFAAQYPNAGWPQVWPLQGGYHDAITYNDDAMIQVLGLLREVANGADEFAFVPTKVRARAAQSVRHGIECILATQIVTRGRRTVWCQQHDALTLEPCSARNYEMPSQSSAESAGIMLFLMEEPEPSPKIIAAVNAAAAWFEQTKIGGVAYRFMGDSGRMLVDAPGNGPIWARYYDIESNRPIFGDRDKTIHDEVNEISKERRNGYAWYRDTPTRALERYAEWRKKNFATH